jgi:hypothetical protein
MSWCPWSTFIACAAPYPRGSTPGQSRSSMMRRGSPPGWRASASGTAAMITPSKVISLLACDTAGCASPVCSSWITSAAMDELGKLAPTAVAFRDLLAELRTSVSVTDVEGTERVDRGREPRRGGSWYSARLERAGAESGAPTLIMATGSSAGTGGVAQRIAQSPAATSVAQRIRPLPRWRRCGRFFSHPSSLVTPKSVSPPSLAMRPTMTIRPLVGAIARSKERS